MNPAPQDRFLVHTTASGKRRCQSVSPVHGEQCEKKRKHVKKDGAPGPVHKAGSLVWGDNGEHRHVSKVVVEVPGRGRLVNPEVLVGGVDLSRYAMSVDFGGNFEAKAFQNSEASTKRLPEPAADRVKAFADEAGVKLDQWQTGLIDEAFQGDQDNSAENELKDWWFKVAHDEVERTVPKAVEYGSTDLLDIGTMLARTLRRSVTEEEAAELGVFFYLIGKIARWQSAIERGERPSDDTLFDIGVYVRMAQRIRHSGGWPGTEEK